MPPTKASNGPNPVGGISSPPATVAVGVGPPGEGVTPSGGGVAPSGVGEPVCSTRVAVGTSSADVVGEATIVGGVGAADGLVGTAVAVAPATTGGVGLGARNLVYTTRPAIAIRPIISRPTKPTTTIRKSLLCPALGFAIFSLPSGTTSVPKPSPAKSLMDGPQTTWGHPPTGRLLHRARQGRSPPSQ